MQRPPNPPPPPATLLVVGAGGALGSAVLAEALAVGRFRRVGALVAGPVASALRGFGPVPASALAGGAAVRTDTAIVVFERGRRSNGRDEAFVQPAPADLLPLARSLRRLGVLRLLVVVPHAPALLPQALKQGLASLDEGAVAALGFEHLVFLRAAQDGAPDAAAGLPQQLARWWLSQLRWMVPQGEQPLRTATLARCVALLARLLPASAPGTRVLAPETLRRAAQDDAGLEPALRAWLQPGRRP